MGDIKASVIIPVYNQKTALYVTLKSFERQSIDNSLYEIIVIDDGSTDGLFEEFKLLHFNIPHLRYFSYQNSGRASARNRGIEKAQSENIIFCDADRFVENDYVVKHLKYLEEADVVVGLSRDYWGNKGDILKGEFDFNKIKKFSRLYNYSEKIRFLYDEKGRTESGLAWMSFMVGNSSVKKGCLIKAGLFDEDFVQWGFEHLELGLRLQECGAIFQLSDDIYNFHIPHKRQRGFYKDMIEDSISIFKLKHPNYRVDLLKDFLFGKISLQVFEKYFSNSLTIKEFDDIKFYM